MILFADDIVIFTTNPISLQSEIDSVYHYSEQWGLKINVKGSMTVRGVGMFMSLFERYYNV